MARQILDPIEQRLVRKVWGGDRPTAESRDQDLGVANWRGSESPMGVLRQEVGVRPFPAIVRGDNLTGIRT